MTPGEFSPFNLIRCLAKSSSVFPEMALQLRGRCAVRDVAELHERYGSGQDISVVSHDLKTLIGIECQFLPGLHYDDAQTTFGPEAHSLLQPLNSACEIAHVTP